MAITDTTLIWILALGMALVVGIVSLMVVIGRRRRHEQKELESLRRSLDEARSKLSRATASARSEAMEPQDIRSSKGTTPSVDSGGQPAANCQAPRAPEIPAELVTAIQEQRVVLVVGSGLRSRAGLPTGNDLLEKVVDKLFRSDDVSTDQFKHAIRQSGPTAAIDAILNLKGREPLLKALRDLLNGEPAPIHRALASLACPVVLDMTWEDLVPKAFGSSTSTSIVVTPEKSQGLSATLRTGGMVIVKPLGSFDDNTGPALTNEEYKQRLQRFPEFARAIAALFSSRNFLFIGMSLDAIDLLIDGLPPQTEVTGTRHYAVLGEKEIRPLWEAGRGQRYGVAILSYSPSADDKELDEFVGQLRTSAPTSRWTTGRSPAAPKHGDIRITSATLQNIGLFREMKIEFEPGWTLLLGNNGGGKSTILRALALALAGNDESAKKAAEGLLKAGEQTGKVELTLGASKLTTDLVRDSGAVRYKSHQTTPVEANLLLGLGFPALRGMSVNDPKGYTTVKGSPPTVADLGPLLEGGADGRLDNLKQWIVNIAGQAQANPSSRSAQMLRIFTEMVREMVPGEDLEYSHVDDNFNVWMKTLDGPVPIAAVSQGMSGILNWVGILLQRLYDIYPDSEKPEEGLAIVFIDEIDAHLHPSWQRRLVDLTRKHFKNVQIIASSHSPLLAGAVKQSELRIVRRSASGQMQAERSPQDFSGWKVEDILTSPLFEMKTTRSPNAEETIRQYFELFEKHKRTPQEDADLARLRKDYEQLNYGLSMSERTLVESADHIVAEGMEKFDNLSGEAAALIQARLMRKNTDK